MSTPPIVAVVHANPATMAPVTSAFTHLCGDADLWHLLDDRLVSDAERAGGLTDSLRERMTVLIDYAVGGGADAVQLACSMYGPVATAAQHPVPVLASDQAMFDEVVRGRARSVTVLASLDAAAEDSVQRLTEALSRAGQRPRIEPVVSHEAKEASAADDVGELGAALARTVSAVDSDVVVLAQYSLAPALDRVRAATPAPVLSAPHLAAISLATLLARDAR